MTDSPDFSVKEVISLIKQSQDTQLKDIRSAVERVNSILTSVQSNLQDMAQRQNIIEKSIHATPCIFTENLADRLEDKIKALDKQSLSMKSNEDILRNMITDISVTLSKYTPEIEFKKEIKDLQTSLNTKAEKEYVDKIVAYEDRYRERKFKLWHLGLAILAAIVGTSSLIFTIFKYLVSGP